MPGSPSPTTDPAVLARLLGEHDRRFRELFERIEQIAVQGYDRQHRVIFWNEASTRLYGWTREEAMGRRLEELIIPPPAREAVAAGIDAWAAGGPPIPAAALALQHRDGHAVHVYSSHTMQRNADGEPEMYCVDIDLGERMRMEAALRDSEHRLSMVLTVTGEGVWDLDLATGIAHHNARWAELLGLDPASTTHTQADFERHLHPADRAAVEARVAACLAGHGQFHSEHRMLHADGRELWVEDRGDVVERDADGRPLRMLGAMGDITARKHAERAVHQLAYFDALTGLPNRRLLLDRLGQALAAARRRGGVGAVLHLDLDDFKTINDARGHAQGDAVLAEVARRLAAVLDGGDTLARVGGDEFVVVLAIAGDGREAALAAVAALAARLQAALEAPCEVDGEAVRTAATLGITLFPDGEQDAEDLLREAGTAMDRAKQAGNGQVAYYASTMRDALHERLALERDLREALDGDGLEAWVQPQVDAAGRCVGGELLLRWTHAARGAVPPSVFIPVAERSSLILALGDVVLRAGCATLLALQRAGHALTVSVNVSPRQFRQADFVQRVRAALADSGARPDGLVLEVTENLLIEDLEQTIERMGELAALGVRFAIDDFGTGYSSLAYLRRLPLYELKIDQAFVQSAPRDPNDGAIVRLILSMARSLGLRVVAEGVETPAQAAFLVEHGCECMQGYLFARPMPLAAWFARLADAPGAAPAA